ncbi:helix-turn-helix transcriptional regulator (plasmid) [Paenibacillus peoriae]|uniref:Helix-turn-helix transcriptional regulator n=1 Tax=Paenibacillus peoriae TaxID=59893 RepID=A0A7H0YH20_9BACL|nr:helix-turn-helix transcriptional regulator [Paenibacillus peoriae]QNR70378.1 helix-turn-helix transcriptional regulator [Paenibacillus peoriae]
MGLTVTGLSDKIGINRGSLSAALNGSKPFSVSYLDAITTALGEEEGWLYRYFIEDYFRDGAKASRKRLEPFIIRCAELDREDCIREVFYKLSENGDSFLSIMYDVADQLYKKSYAPGEALIYNYIVKFDYDYQSERLAYAHYRLFRLSIGDANQELRAVTRFEPFLYRLPDSVQLDAILTIINVHYFQEMWQEAELYGMKLIKLAERVCETRMHSRINLSEYASERPLVYYYGYGYLTRSSALQKMGKYHEARMLIPGYADLDKFPIKDEEKSEYEIGRFKVWAKANIRTLELLLGNSEYLPGYIQFIKENDDELMAGLLTITEAANLHGFDITSALADLSDKVMTINTVKGTDKSSYCMLMYNLAVYFISRGMNEDGLNCAIRSVSVAVNINNNDFFRQSVTVFESYRKYATATQEKDFLLALKGGETIEKISSTPVLGDSTLPKPAIS